MHSLRDEGPTSILKRRDKSSSPLGELGRHSPTGVRSRSAGEGGSRPVWSSAASRFEFFLILYFFLNLLGAVVVVNVSHLCLSFSFWVMVYIYGLRSLEPI